MLPLIQDGKKANGDIILSLIPNIVFFIYNIQYTCFRIGVLERQPGPYRWQYSPELSSSCLPVGKACPLQLPSHFRSCPPPNPHAKFDKTPNQVRPLTFGFSLVYEWHMWGGQCNNGIEGSGSQLIGKQMTFAKVNKRNLAIKWTSWVHVTKLFCKYF